MQLGKVMKAAHENSGAGIRGEAIRRLFNYNSNDSKKDKARLENARIHSVLSVAGLAAALAASASVPAHLSRSSEMSSALASATQLLASYCIEMAESAGADRERVASVVGSAIGFQTASHLLTLTAGAATALRGEAALRGRLLKEAKRSSAVISPDDLTCEGDLLQLTHKGMLRWRHVVVYINKAHQVKIKLKSKHVGGAFTKINKCIVYKVIDKSDEWPFKKGRENMEVYIGFKTSHGLLEFKCKSKVHKQKWVYGIQKIMQRRSRFEEAENSLRMLHINKGF
ncbi:hypothetical protein CASFOL_004877 [Castilleja foliolosa]|uniref:PH domain-containing protein n=1 Tax=Castilleja foliolosa TaxID=1961234 RepID=A0ABD3EBU0_9LAMI